MASATETLKSVAEQVTGNVKQVQDFVDESLKHLSPGQRRNLKAVLLLVGLSSIVKQKRAAALSLAMNLAVFSLHAWPNQSDKYYDTIGAITHLSLALFSLMSQKRRASQRQVLNTLFSVMWITRLGSFLYTRILVHKQDKRMNNIKKDVYAFSLAFVLQSIWCYLGQLPLLVSNSNEDKEDTLTWTYYDLVGRSLFVFGFLFEVVADAQKTAFNSDPSNQGKFITEGLWAMSRHPNHFGEICLQFGIAISATPLFKRRTDYLAYLGPLFTTLLLTKVSGVPMLEKAGMEKWGKDPDYLKYLASTPELIPKFF